MKQREIEIMSPVGSYESLRAAIQAGANSVYFGVGKMNMRARSSVNFTLDDLAEITAICRQHHIKSYLTLNTVVFDEEIEAMKQLVDAAKQHGVTAIIASDLSVLEYCRQTGMETHISTQCNITNLEAVKFFSRYADVMVTSRELSLEQVKNICRQIKEQNIRGPKNELVKIEIFVHGALCMAVSGKCYLSLHNHNHSANRGSCFQDCRRGYLVKDLDNQVELAIENEYIMSPKDLKTIPFLDQILDAGVSVLKIEGRGRSAEYVKTVTECYQEAVKSYFEQDFTQEKIDVWDKRLASVYNRGFWEGYYMGKTLGEWSNVHGSVATHKKIFVGTVANYFSNLQIAHIHINTQDLKVGDEIIVSGPTTGVYQAVIPSMVKNDQTCEFAEKGEDPTIPVTQLVRRGDKVYKVVENTD